MFYLGKHSIQNMVGVHPALVLVMGRAIQLTPVDFTITEGMREIERQELLVASGASTTMNSRHLTGHAVDIAPWVAGDVNWAWPLFYQLETVVKQAAAELGIAVEWGGDWQTLKDGPHWELAWAQYPIQL